LVVVRIELVDFRRRINRRVGPRTSGGVPFEIGAAEVDPNQEDEAGRNKDSDVEGEGRTAPEVHPMRL
jgi:hypothetical protein